MKIKTTYHTPHGNLDFSSPRVMGIINSTPDSFYSASRVTHEKAVIERVEAMILEGADIIDIGGSSTRPNSTEPDEAEELNRVLEMLKIIRPRFMHIPISIDTYRSNIAKAAWNEGADIINDISGGAFDNKLILQVSQMNIPYVLMHVKGNRQSMHQIHTYQNVIEEVFNYFEDKINILKNAGIQQIIIDPGFGFSKQLEDNYKLLGALNKFKEKLGYPIMVGVSRKRMIQHIIGTDADHALNGTTAVNVIALLHGASLLRVHDVKEAKEAIKISEFFLKLNNNSDTL
ncbi:MAG: dihydropteroate synthase [Flavobacteriales bacterium]|nr:dihydropteroate synthase [Flavobacteriales bacterium]